MRWGWWLLATLAHALFHLQLVRWWTRDVKYSLFWSPDFAAIHRLRELKLRWSRAYLSHLGRLNVTESRQGRVGTWEGVGSPRRVGAMGLDLPSRLRSRGTRANAIAAAVGAAPICIGFVGLAGRPGHFILQSVASVLQGGGVVEKGGGETGDRGGRPSSRLAPGVALVVYLASPANGEDMSAGRDHNVGVLDDVAVLRRAGIDVLTHDTIGAAAELGAGGRRRAPDGGGGHNAVQGPMDAWGRKENIDYAHVLGACVARLGPRMLRRGYVVILEEDTWATPDFMAKLRRAVAQVEMIEDGALGTPARAAVVAATPREGEGNVIPPKWAAMKLFVTGFWNGWDKFDRFVLPAYGLAFGLAAVLLLAGTVGGAWAAWVSLKHGASSSSAVAASTVAAVRRRPLPGMPFSFSFFLSARRRPWQVVVVVAYAWALATFTLYAVGKQGARLHTFSQAGVHASDMGASTLGLVYPGWAALSLASFIRNHTGSAHTDQLVGKWREGLEGASAAASGGFSAGRQYIVVPNLVEHVGVISSSVRKHAGRSGMAFEEMWVQTMKHASRFDDHAAEQLLAQTRRWEGGIP